MVFVDVNVDFLDGSGGTVVGGDTEFAIVSATRFVRASIDELQARGAVHVVASVVRQRLALSGADALVVHSRLTSISGPAVIESTTSRLRLIGSIVEATADPDLGPASVQWAGCG